MQKIITILSVLLVVFSGCSENNVQIPVFVSVREGKTIGANTDSNSLNFGILPPGASSSKTITVENNKHRSCHFELIPTGETAEWLSMEKEFNLKKGNSKEIQVNMNVPLNTANSEFQGGLSVVSWC